MKKFLFITIITLFTLSACSTDENNDTSEQNANNEENLTEQKEEKTPEYYVDPTTFQILPKNEDTNPQVALLTFDDAPDQYAVDIAHTLKEHDVSAIFFVNGMYLESEEGKKRLKEIYDLGFEIGNHTQTHPYLDTLSYEETEYEIKETNALVEEITGEKPRFFRAPFGINTEASATIVENEGMQFMNWTYGYDFEAEYQNKDALEDIMVNTELLSNGANLLMHDREWTRDAISNIILGLRDKDYELVNPNNIDLN